MKRRYIKKQLRHYRMIKSHLPVLIDCSEVYGDNTYTQRDMEMIDKKIEELESSLAALEVETIQAS